MDLNCRFSTDLAIRAVLVTEVAGPDATVSTFGCKIAHSFEQGDSLKISDELKVAAKDKSMATSGDYDYISQNFNFVAGYNFRGIDASYTLLGIPILASTSTGGALHLGARYHRTPASGIGFMLGATYDFTRSGGDSFLVIDPALTFGIGRAYVFAGPNYSVPLSRAL